MHEVLREFNLLVTVMMELFADVTHFFTTHHITCPTSENIMLQIEYHAINKFYIYINYVILMLKFFSAHFNGRNVRQLFIPKSITYPWSSMDSTAPLSMSPK